MDRLERPSVPLVPHIVLGLHYGKLLGEWTALEMIARHRPKLVVLVVLRPLYGTPRGAAAPPPFPRARVGGNWVRAVRAAQRLPAELPEDFQTSPEHVRVSLAAAMTLGRRAGRMFRNATCERVHLPDRCP